MNYAVIEADLCKGCRLCVETCPRHCLEMSGELNALGYEYARFARQTCTACGLCFYACPEPSAVTVYADEPAGTDERSASPGAAGAAGTAGRAGGGA